jgi:hypothetical protein
MEDDVDKRIFHSSFCFLHLTPPAGLAAGIGHFAGMHARIFAWTGSRKLIYSIHLRILPAVLVAVKYGSVFRLHPARCERFFRHVAMEGN